MTTYSTGNPVGSSDARDLYDNAENLDNAANSDNATWTDRLGRLRRTIAGIEQDAITAIQNAGYVGTGTDDAVEDYAAGIEITQYNQIVRDPSSGEFWRVSGSETLPYTLTGAGVPEGGALVSVGDAALRQDLAANVTAGGGALNVAGSVIYVDTIADLQALPTSELVSGQVAVVYGSELRWDGSIWVPIGSINVGAFGAVVNSTFSQDSALTSAHSFADSFGVPVEYNQGFYTADLFEKPWKSKAEGKNSTWRVNGVDVAIPENGTTTGPMQFFVDSINGNDLTGNGISPNAPYKTIQAAWESAPSHLRHYSTMQLADGNYQASVIPGSEQPRAAVLWGKGKTTSIRSYLSGSDIISALTIKGNPTTPGNVTITTTAEYTHGVYFNKGNFGLQDLTVTASTAASFLITSHRTDTYVHCRNVIANGVFTGRTKFGILAESSAQIEFIDGEIKNCNNCVGALSAGCTITMSATQGQTLITGGNGGVLCTNGAVVSLNALKDGIGKTKFIDNCTTGINAATGGTVTARGQDSASDMLQIDSLVRVQQGTLDLVYCETLGVVICEHGSNIKYNSSNFQDGVTLFASNMELRNAKSFVSPSTKNNAVRPITIESGSRIYYVGTNQIVGSTDLPASYNVTNLSFTSDNQTLNTTHGRDRYNILADTARIGAQISSVGVEEGRVIYLIGYGNQVTFNGAGTHTAFTDSITIGNASGNLTGATLMMSGGKWRIVSVGDMRT